ncbi:hypothetical protein BJ956_001855 [Arthrobacter psychrochitiniphilus]|nr:hypothetical protein [Arthrobacter psychrochitiniphilus]
MSRMSLCPTAPHCGFLLSSPHDPVPTTGTSPHVEVFCEAMKEPSITFRNMSHATLLASNKYSPQTARVAVR